MSLHDLPVLVNNSSRKRYAAIVELAELCIDDDLWTAYVIGVVHRSQGSFLVNIPQTAAVPLDAHTITHIASGHYSGKSYNLEDVRAIKMYQTVRKFMQGELYFREAERGEIIPL